MKHMRLVGAVFSERDRETDEESRAREAHLSQDADDCDFYGDAEDDDDPFDAFDCAMDRSGNCGKAGSEECDWECPYQKLPMTDRAPLKGVRRDREGGGDEGGIS